MFWIGLFIGLFIGANVGLVIFGLFAAKRTGSPHECYDLKISHDTSCHI